MGTNSIPAGSDSVTPDLDWSQIRETVRMLYLAVAQIDISMRQGDDSILALTDSFTSMAHGIEAIRALLEGTPAEHSAREQCQELSSKVQTAIIAFQFYDKLTQKLAHVSRSLNSLSGLVADGNRLYSPREWLRLQEQIRSAYTVADERVVFDALMRGVSIEEAMLLASAKTEAASDGEIELF